MRVVVLARTGQDRSVARRHERNATRSRSMTWRCCFGRRARRSTLGSSDGFSLASFGMVAVSSVFATTCLDTSETDERLRREVPDDVREVREYRDKRTKKARSRESARRRR